MGYESFRELRVWQNAKELAVEVYRLTGAGALSRDFGLKDQMQRSAISIASNIAEGYDRGSNNDFAGFLYFSKGSLSELLTQLEIAKEINYIDNNKFIDLENKCSDIGKMLTKLIKVRKKIG